MSTTNQDLERQIHALEQVGIDPARIFVDKKSGTTIDRPGLRAALEYAREGDVLVVHTLDRLGRTVRDTLNLIRDLAQRGVGGKNLADLIRVSFSSPSDPMAQMPVVLLALFAQMERTCTVERAAHARSVATAKSRRVDRLELVGPYSVARAALFRGQGERIARVVATSGIARASLCRHLPPRPEPSPTHGGDAPRWPSPPGQGGRSDGRRLSRARWREALGWRAGGALGGDSVVTDPGHGGGRRVG